MALRLLVRRTGRARVTVRGIATEAAPTLPRARAWLGGAAAVVAGGLLAAYYSDNRSAVHTYVLMPLLHHALEAEAAHRLSLKALSRGLGPRDRGEDDGVLATQLWGEQLSSPVGLAAGFDKDGEAVDGLLDLGFSWVEIGSVTPEPQAGNPQPRVFHLLPDSAIINRYGFPSKGHAYMLAGLRKRLGTGGLEPLPPKEHASRRPHQLLAINLGKNKTSAADSPEDYLAGVRKFHQWADALVINVSSPNTPGLRNLQKKEMLASLLKAVVDERDALCPEATSTSRRPRLLVKVAPDLNEQELKDVAEAVNSCIGIDGVIVSNTTIQRPPTLSSVNALETGGLSGPPLLPLSLRALRTLRTHLAASTPLIGCGGIASGADALEFARAGASAVQLYTAFAVRGPGAPRRIKDELAALLRAEGTTWQAAVNGAVARSARDAQVRELTRQAEALLARADKLGEAVALGEEVVVLG